MAFMSIDCASTGTNAIDIIGPSFTSSENFSGRRGLEVTYNTAFTGSVNIHFSSVHDCEDFGVVLGGAILSTTQTMFFTRHCRRPRMPNQCNIPATSWTIDSNILIRTGNNNGWTLNDVGGTFTNNTVAGATAIGINLAKPQPSEQ